MIEWEMALEWEAETAWVVLVIDIPHQTIEEEVDIKRVKMNVDMAEGVDTIDPLQYTGKREAGKREAGSEKGRG